MHHRDASPAAQAVREGRHGEIPVRPCRRQQHRDGADALFVWQLCVRVHAGGLPHGVPFLRVHAGGPRSQPYRGRNCKRNLRRDGRHRRARFPHCADGHWRTAGQLRQCDGFFINHLLPAGREHRHAQHQPFHLRPCAHDGKAGAEKAGPDAFGKPARPHKRDAFVHDAGERRLPAGKADSRVPRLPKGNGQAHQLRIFHCARRERFRADSAQTGKAH